ncbi:MAG: type IV secretory system conjugative DNA transfer family protein [Acidimicrobiales bacterium]
MTAAPALVGALVLATALRSFGSGKGLGRSVGRGSTRPDRLTAPARWATGAELAPLRVSRPVPGRLVVGRAGRRLLAGERGHSLLVVGPTQSHKTSGLAIPALLEWEGPVLAASVKADLARHTLSWRRRQGPAWLYDPSHSTGLRASPWSPLQACTSWIAARRMAHTLTEAARPAAGALTDGDFWYATAAKLLGPLLLAARCAGLAMTDVVRWVEEQEEAEVTSILLAAGELEALRAARATWGRDDRQRSAVYTTTETVVEAFADVVDPGGEAVDPTALLDEAGTLYLCAPSHEQQRLRPLFSALTAEVLTTAFTRSAREGGPLTPPLLVVLDEAANVAPLAELDVLASTAAGHGIQLVTVWQDLSQLTARYGARAGSVVNNHRAKLFLSGIADPATLEHASVLAGDTEHRLQAATRDAHGAQSVSESAALRRLVPPDALRRMPPGKGLLLSGHLPPVRVSLRPWWRDAELRRRARSAPVAPDQDALGDLAGAPDPG